MQQQLQNLVGKRFIIDTDYIQLAHYPRYLKAMAVRMDKLRADPSRDAKLMAEWSSVASHWQRMPKRTGHDVDPKLIEFRWLLEELRVSLFAQRATHADAGICEAAVKVWGKFVTLGDDRCGVLYLLFYRCPTIVASTSSATTSKSSASREAAVYWQ